MLHNEVREEYVWHSGDLMGCLLILLCSVSTANGQMQHPQPQKDVIIRDLYPSWIMTRESTYRIGHLDQKRCLLENAILE